MFAIFLPVLALFFSFVVDGAHAFLEKRSVQNAADASALAAAQELGLATLACNADPVCRQQVYDAIENTATLYSGKNGGAAVDHYCTDRYGPDDDPPSDPSQWGYPNLLADRDDNCFTWPWKGSPGKVEVKLQSGGPNFRVSRWFLPEFFTDDFTVPARAVASAQAISETTCTDEESPTETPCPGPPGYCDATAAPSFEETPCPAEPGEPAQQGTLDVGETSHCVFDPPVEDPDQYLGTNPPCTVVTFGEGGVEGAQGFAMSRRCDAILYTGTPATANNAFPILGAFATNGGLTFTGRAGKRLDTLGFDKARCGSLLPEPPSGDPAACDAAATAKNNPQSCVRNLIDFGDRLPLNWPVPPPLEPTPLPAGTTWDPAVHYPRYCILLTPPEGSNTVVLTDVPGPPGIYCVSGLDTVLLINNSMTAGDGYTFFGLDGARIEVASNGTSVRFYWPSACGSRPTTRILSFVCFDRRIVGYDPLTVLYSSQSTPFPALCEESAVCIRGSGGSIEGDIFAPEPRALAPPTSLTQGGGTVWIAGGGAAAGNGFIEAWQITIQGNSATYTGTGPLVGGPPTVVQQGELVFGEDVTCVFNPPVENPDQYADDDPPCYFPGTPPTFFPFVETGPQWYRQETTIVGIDVGMDE